MSKPIILRRGYATATVEPELGANVLAWAIGDHALLASPPNIAALRAKPASYGAPILFPFPNRLREGAYTHRGVARRMGASFEGADAVHGLLLLEPWEVTLVAKDEVTMELPMGERSHLMECYPFAARLRLTILLTVQSLCFELTVENEGASVMPFGFGLHPVFAIPLSKEGTRSRTEISVPCKGVWQMERGLPTGKIEPADGRFSLSGGKRLGHDEYDVLFTQCHGDLASITDLERQRRISIQAPVEDGFREWQVVAPSDRNVVTVEPYTCPTDAFNLTAKGVECGLRELAPGESWTGRVMLTAMGFSPH